LVYHKLECDGGEQQSERQLESVLRQFGADSKRGERQSADEEL